MEVETLSIMTHKATGAAAISTTLAPWRAFQILEARIKLSAAGGAGDFTATLDANAGAAYDLNIITQDMTTVQHYVFQPTRPMAFEANDEIDFAWANAGGKTYGLTIIYELI
jgi:hypothetical protein